MFTNLQAPSQASMERWLTDITARTRNQGYPGFKAYKNSEKIQILTFTV